MRELRAEMRLSAEQAAPPSNPQTHGAARPALRWARLVVLPVLLCSAGALSAADPLATAQAFCRLDGQAERLHPLTWANVAPLVTWQLEPAWDHVKLISAYRLATPRTEGEAVLVNVTYTVVAEVRPGKVLSQARAETAQYRLLKDEGGQRWRLDAPPPVPHVFASQVDAEAMAESLLPGSKGYLSDSALVWKTLSAAHPALPYLSTTELATAPFLSPAEERKPGAVVLYLSGEIAYHVAVLETEDMVRSATLNGGVQRSPIDAFAGERRLFLVRPVLSENTAESVAAHAPATTRSAKEARRQAASPGPARAAVGPRRPSPPATASPDVR